MASVERNNMKVEVKHCPAFERYGHTFPATTFVVVDGITFTYYPGGYVGEVGTTRKWSPENPYGFKLNGGETIAITSFGDFGTDRYVARDLADRWCERARRAYEVFTA